MNPWLTHLDALILGPPRLSAASLWSAALPSQRIYLAELVRRGLLPAATILLLLNEQFLARKSAQDRP